MVRPAELTGILGDLAEVGSLEFNVDTCFISSILCMERSSSPSSRRRMASLEEAKIILLLTGASSGDLSYQYIPSLPPYKTEAPACEDSPHNKAELVPNTLTTW